MATGTSTVAPSPTLSRLLDEELAFSPSFQRIYSSHLAMSLVALEQLGADAARLEAAFAAHAHDGRAEPRDDVEDLERRLVEIARDGIGATVRRRVPLLLQAPGTALFHPVIRLAYALDVGHAGQVAAALLDWDRRQDRYDCGITVSRGSRRLPDVADALAERLAGTWGPTFDLSGVAARPEVAAALQGVALDDQTLDDVSTFALAAHVAADHFLTLHLVTGARALRTVAGALDADVAQRLVHHAVPIMAIAYAAAGAPPLLPVDALDALRSSALPTGEEVSTSAIASSDPHVIKLADVALAEERRTHDLLYRHIAARVVGLVH